MENNILDSKTLKIVILAIGCFVILAFVFGLGVFVGSQKAEFSFKWAEQYHRNFAGPKEGFLGDFMGKDFINGNGCFGQIIKIDGNSLTIKDNRDNTEKIIIAGDETTVTYQKENIKLSGLKVGDNVVVIGEPNENGQINARLIRIMPPPPVSFNR